MKKTQYGNNAIDLTHLKCNVYLSNNVNTDYRAGSQLKPYCLHNVSVAFCINSTIVSLHDVCLM